MNQQVTYSSSPKVGKFSIMDELLQDDAQRPWLRALFGLCVVLETQRDESGRGVEYICASELFQPLGEGEEIPKYRIDMTHTKFVREEDELRRLNSGPFGFVATRQIILRVPPAQMSMRPVAPNQLH